MLDTTRGTGSAAPPIPLGASRQAEAMSGALVVSGSLAVRMDLDEAFATSNLVYTIVSTAAQAETVLRHSRVALMIVDPVLRDADGIAFVVQQLEQDPQLWGVPTMMLCTEGEFERFGSATLGWDVLEFLGKPYDKEHILDRALQLAGQLDPKTGEPARPGILVVSEDPKYTLACQEHMGHDGFDVAVAGDTAEAQRLLQQREFEAIIVEMQAINRATHNLRRWTQTSSQRSNAAVIVVTETDDRDSMLAVFSSGADDYVTKASSIEGLTGRMRAQIRRKKTELDARRVRETLLIKAMQTTEAERARRSAEARATLLAELETKNVELERARQAAEAGTEAKSAFLASMSHEIRTPMTAILGMAELMDDASLDAEQRMRLDIIRSSGAHLLTLIDQILDFSKIEANKLTLHVERMDLRLCVEEALEIVAYQAAQKGIEVLYDLKPGTPTLILADSGRIRQVLINFLGNAVKFTENGQVKLVVTSLWKAGDEFELELAVHDTGIGIAPDKLPTVFDSFTQLDHSPARRYTGTGLGLTICKRLAELMNGEVSVESTLGAGSIFRFRLPTRRVVLDRRQDDLDISAIRGRRILLVDDNADAIKSLSSRIEQLGAEVHTARSAADIDDLLNAGQKFDLGLIDRVLPDISGDDVARQLLQRHPEPQPPLLMLSPVTGAHHLAPEFSGFLSKPVREADLRRELVRVLARATSPDAEPVVDPLADALLPSGTRILVVEDNPMNLKVADLMLTRMGVSPEMAESAPEAIMRVEEQEFDVILMDVNMPGMDGIEATRVIREFHGSGDGHQPAIIALTASAMREDRERCLNAGMDDFVSKPMNRQILHQAIRRALTKQRHRHTTES